jgi:hypothetical protein
MKTSIDKEGNRTGWRSKRAQNRIQGGELVKFLKTEDTGATWHVWLVPYIEGRGPDGKKNVYLSLKAGDEVISIRVLGLGQFMIMLSHVVNMCKHACGDESLRMVVSLGQEIVVVGGGGGGGRRR